MDMQTIDPVEVSPANYKVLLENEHVRVLDMNVKPGESDKEHSHPSETVYFAKGGKLKIHLPDGKSMDVEVPDGHVMWHEAWTHRVENVGTTDVHGIIVESKS